jgi:hypothetical protein
MLCRTIQSSTQRPSTFGIINSISSQQRCFLVSPRKRLFSRALYLAKNDSSKPIPVIYRNPKKNLLIMLYLEVPEFLLNRVLEYRTPYRVDRLCQYIPKMSQLRNSVIHDEIQRQNVIHLRDFMNKSRTTIYDLIFH